MVLVLVLLTRLKQNQKKKRERELHKKYTMGRICWWWIIFLKSWEVIKYHEVFFIQKKQKINELRKEGSIKERSTIKQEFIDLFILINFKYQQVLVLKELRRFGSSNVQYLEIPVITLVYTLFVDIRWNTSGEGDQLD
eukprot:TRINITY_DN6916_c0_g2_i1.p1 TRINITY_DN6916_c0_g2~~TRINITY_DN6916_c0_g2_i1.p1  ORF type:complete len:138 (-),score=9.80 TRINITY_DN6916_c0_g2_i1:42-455(-)